MPRFVQFAPYIQILFLLLLVGMLIRRKRMGHWKRPWSFPVAMTLLGVALAMNLLSLVLNHFDL